MTDSTEETSIYEIIPASPDYSHYMGSLTTPPCTEVGNSRINESLYRNGHNQLLDCVQGMFFSASRIVNSIASVDEAPRVNLSTTRLRMKVLHYCVG